MNMTDYRSRVEGCLFGLALGDALGAPTEFVRFDAIVEKWGPMGPEEPPLPVASVTDDTQMALAVGSALMRMADPSDSAQWYDALRSAFLEWYYDLDNNRSPGITCMQSMGNIASKKHWRDATAVGSKGCGANMRVQPVGLLTDRHGFHVKKRAALAQLQGAITHGHPTALTASELTAHAIHLLLSGLAPEELPGRLLSYAESQRGVYHEDVLGNLWERAGESSDNAYSTHGWNEMMDVLGKLQTALETPDRDGDPGKRTGHGWIAEEALATALHCFLLFPDDPVMTIRRGAATGGDSDSIACIAGALAGVYHGIDAWPSAWLERIEYHERIQKLADWFCK